MIRVIRIVGAFVAALALVAVAGALAESTGGEGPRKLVHPDYVGKGRFDRSMRVAFRIRERRGRRVVQFQASNVSFVCNENTEHERRDLETISAELDGKEFERTAWGNSDTTEIIYWIRGELIDSERRAKGFVRATVNPPQEHEDAGVHECTTYGIRSWVAKRVRNHGRVDGPDQMGAVLHGT